MDVGSAFRQRLGALGGIGAAPDDNDEERLQKMLLVASTTMMASLAVVVVDLTGAAKAPAELDEAGASASRSHVG